MVIFYVYLPQHKTLRPIKDKDMTKLILLFCSAILLSCSSKGSVETIQSTSEIKKTENQTNTPIFHADSAYSYIEKQVAFGYRIPNTPAHKVCGNFLSSELKRF